MDTRGLLMNIQGIIIINGNPRPIPPHQPRTILTTSNNRSFRVPERTLVLQKFNEERSRRANFKFAGANKLIIKIAERKRAAAARGVNLNKFPSSSVFVFYCNQIQEIHGECNCWQMQLSIAAKFFLNDSTWRHVPTHPSS